MIYFRQDYLFSAQKTMISVKFWYFFYYFSFFQKKTLLVYVVNVNFAVVSYTQKLFTHYETAIFWFAMFGCFFHDDPRPIVY